MRVHVLQHVPFEGLGSVFTWLQARNAIVTTTRLFEAASFPALSEFDVLVALGGPMSVNDEDDLPWLRDEKRLVREAILSGKAVLGICLGAQLMASSLGARVYPGSNKEIGWFPIYACEHHSDAFVFPTTTDGFRWHGETFDLPNGATHLAKSEGCLHQAFQVGERAIGLQFHLETTAASADAIISNCRDELVPARYIQTEQELRAVPPSRYAGINALMESVLGYITRGAA